jgi:hypothetical protein
MRLTELTRDNPHFQRLTRKYRSFVEIIFLIAVSIIALSLISDSIAYVLIVLAYIGAFFMPTMAAIYAARLAGNDIRSESYQAMRITNLGADRIVWGYVGAALYNFRIEIALLLCVIPAAAKVLTHEYWLRYLSDLSSSPMLPYWRTLFALWPILALPGNVLMACVLALMLVLWLRNTLGALSLVTTLMAMYSVIMLIAFLALYGPSSQPIVPALGFFIIGLLLPYLISFGVGRYAYRRV